MAKILIADDDRVMRDLLITLLDLEGDEAATVSKPEEIIPCIQEENPDLVLVDYHLSGGDSLLTVKELKSDPVLRDVPVLMTSGMDVEQKCLAAGADSFIMKPWRPNSLLERMKEVIETSKAKQT